MRKIVTKPVWINYKKHIIHITRMAAMVEQKNDTSYDKVHQLRFMHLWHFSP